MPYTAVVPYLGLAIGLCLQLLNPSNVFAQQTCANAVALGNASLPYVSPHWGTGSALTTCGSGTDYTSSSPGAAGNNNENGEDYVLAFTASTTVCLDIALTYQGSPLSLFVYDGCPDQPGTASREYDTSGNPREIFGMTFPAGETHYIIISGNGSCGLFQLELTESTGPLGADFCNAHPIDYTVLPFSQAITTCGAVDNYDQNSLGFANCTSGCNYVQDEEYVFEYTQVQAGQFTITIPSGSFTTGLDPGIYLFDGPPDVASTTLLAQKTYNNSSSTATGVTMVRSNLAAGTYYVVVGTKGSPNCTGMTVNMDGPGAAALTVTNVSGTAETCQTADGSLETSVLGGTAPYTYQWDAAAGSQTTQLAIGLAQGSYSVTVTDADGTTATGSGSVARINPINVAIATTSTDCGQANGTATASLTGGTAPLTYTWSIGQTTAAITSLAAGSYTVTASDAEGCQTSGTGTVDPGVSDAVQVTAALTDESCSGLNDGSINLTVTDGTAYDWEWSTGAVTQNISGLTAGNYCVTVNPGCLSPVNAQLFGNSEYTRSHQLIYNAALDAHFVLGDYKTGGTTKKYVARMERDGSFTWVRGFDTDTRVYGIVEGTNNDVLLVSWHNNIFRLYRMDANGTMLWARTFTNALPVSRYPSLVKADGDNYFLCGWTNGDKATVMKFNGSGIPYWIKAFQVNDTQINGVAPNGNDGVIMVGSNRIGSNFPGFLLELDKDGGIVDSLAFSIAGVGVQLDRVAKTSDGGYLIAGSAIPGSGWQDGLLVRLDAHRNLLWTKRWNTDEATYANGLAQDASGNAYVTLNTDLGGDPYATIFKFDASGNFVAAKWMEHLEFLRLLPHQLPNGNILLYGQTSTHPNALGDYSAVWAEVPPSLETCLGTAVTPTFNTFSATLQPLSFTETTLTDAGSAYSAPLTTPTFSNVAPCNQLNVFCYELGSNGGLSVTTQTSDACGTSPSGSITATASGSGAPYTYSWSTGGSGNQQNGLVPGTYTVTVTNASGCTTAATAQVQAGTSAVQANITVTPEACYTANNAQATAAPTGGTAPYTFSWQHDYGSGNTAQIAGIHSPNTYQITVTDAYGCSATETAVDATQPPGVEIYSIVTTNETCTGSGDGVADISAGGQGSSGNFIYHYAGAGGSGPTGSQGTNVVYNLPGKTYDVYVQDQVTGCTSATMQATVGTYGFITVTTAATDAICQQTNGTVQATPQNGSAPYTYLWNDPATQTTAQATGLTAGTYTATVTDVYGCSATVSNTVGNNPGSLTASITTSPESCPNSLDASATANASGGTSAYTYAWQTNQGAYSGQTVYNHTSPQNYAVTVTDANGCSATATAVDNTTPQLLGIQILSQIDPVCDAAANGEVSVSASNGSGSYLYRIYNYGGGSYTTQLSPIFSGLTTGLWEFTVEDLYTGCTSYPEYASLNASGLNVATAQQPTTCQTPVGEATANPGNGATPYTYSWNNGQSNATATALQPGTYTVTVTDGSGCSAIRTVGVANEMQLLVNASLTNADCGASNGAASLAVSNGQSPYTFLWDGAAGGGSSAAVSSLPAGTYSVTVADNGVCSSTSSITITNNAGPVPTLSATVTNDACGTGSGSIDLAASPANGSSYLWNTGATTEDLSNLAADTYCVTVEGACAEAAGTLFIHDDAQSAFASGSQYSTTHNAWFNVGSTTTGTDYSVFTRVENDGTLTFSKRFSTDAKVYDLLETANGEFIAVGWQNNDFKTYRLDASGNLLWSKTYSGNMGNCRYPYVLPAGGDNYFLVGWSAGDRATVIKFDGTGNESWIKAYKLHDTQTMDVISMPGNGLVLVGGSHFSDITGWILKLNNSGNIEAQYRWTSDVHTEFQNVHQTADGGYVIGGFSDSYSNLDGLVVKLDASFNVQWTRTFQAPGYERCLGIAEDNQGNLYASYNTNLGGSTTGTIFKFSGQGDFLAARRIEHTNSLRLSGQTDSQNRLMIWGNANNHPGTSASYSLLNGWLPSNLDLCNSTPVAFSNVNRSYALVPVSFATSTLSGPAQTNPQTVSDVALTAHTICTHNQQLCVNVTEGTALVVALSSVGSCTGGNSGSATATVLSGTAPYSYNWSTGAATASISALAPGSYTVTVQDASGCTAVETTTVAGGNGSNDDWACAEQLTQTTGWCSNAAAFTNAGATADYSPGSCWPAGLNANVWFAFTATQPNIEIQLRTGGTEGTLKYPLLALWKGTTHEQACVSFTSAYSDLTISYGNLVPGTTYYIEVDCMPGGEGSFTLCMDDVVNYDYRAGAYDVSAISGCAPQTYTTVGATADETAASCWPNGPNNNRWFTFQATGTFKTAQLLSNGIKYPMMAIYDATGTDIACASFTNANSNLLLSTNALVPGNWYYIAVDNAPGGAGQFTLCLFDTPTFDYQAGAVAITNTTGYCSSNAAYSTANASPDGQAGSCWPYGPNNNVWFSFTATQSNIAINLETGGSKGTLQYPLMALFDASGTELGCATFQYSYQDLGISYNNLVPGNTYYISVDNAPGATGTFTLCLDDAIGNDFIAGASLLTDFDNWCSTPGQHTTVGASADGPAGSCWPYGPQYNRWFNFTAPANDLIIRLWTLGGNGTMRYPMLAVFDDALNEVGCAKFTNGNTQVVWVTNNTFVPGNTYYISVDNAGSASYTGTFTLCIDDLTGSSAKRTDAELRADSREAADPGIRIYPNPTAHNATLALDWALEKDAHVRLLDVTGKTVLQQRLPAGNQTLALQVGQLPAGLYMVEVRSQHLHKIKRLIIE